MSALQEWTCQEHDRIRCARWRSCNQNLRRLRSSSYISTELCIVVRLLTQHTILCVTKMRSRNYCKSHSIRILMKLAVAQHPVHISIADNYRLGGCTIGLDGCPAHDDAVTLLPATRHPLVCVARCPAKARISMGLLVYGNADVLADRPDPPLGAPASRRHAGLVPRAAKDRLLMG
jgi:hypothetical protein